MEVNFKFDELKDFIKNGDKVYYGDSNSFIYYNGMLIKFYPEVSQMFKKRVSVDENQIMQLFYDNEKEIISPFVDFKKVNYLMDRASKIKLSKMPQGIVYLNDAPIGILENYFPNHNWLHFLEDLSHEEMYYLLRNILLELHELEENGIYQLNINRNNIIYDGSRPQLVDLSSPSVSYGDKKGLEQSVYSKYLNLLYSLLYRQSFDSKIHNEFKDILTLEECSYGVCKDVVKRLKKKF